MESLKDNCSCKCSKKLMTILGIVGILIVVISIILIIVFAPCTSNVKEELNKKSGVISDKMARKVMTPRAGYEDKMEALGLSYYDEPSNEWSSCETDSYWNEEGAIEISAEAEKEILEAT